MGINGVRELGRRRAREWDSGLLNSAQASSGPVVDEKGRDPIGEGDGVSEGGQYEE
jgi:hypothetical protein